MKFTRPLTGFALSILLSSGSPALARQHSETFTPPAQSGEGTAAQSTTTIQATEPYRIERSAQLVLIPALVTDRAGHHIPGLTAADFIVKDDGRAHPIKLLQEISPPSIAMLERTKLPAGTYSNDLNRPKAPLRVVIILFDMLNSHFKDQVPARIQLAKYLNEQAAPGTMVALLGLGRGGLRMYHDLTSDTKGLATELTQSMETGRHSISTNLQGEMSEAEAEEAFVGHGGFARTGSSGRSSKKLIVLDTLAAFKNIAGAYGGIPGRKSLVWVTGGFPFTLDDSKHGGGKLPVDDGDSILDILPDYQSTWQALNNANIALYPVDMHGLLNTAQPDATYRARRGGDTARSLATFASHKQERFEDNVQTFTAFANETGGKAFYNNNDLVAGFKTAVDDSQSSYLLAYALDQDAAPGWHKLRVEVSRPGVHVRARTGFLVPKPNPRHNEAASVFAPKQSLQTSEVNLAMSSPMNYTGIPITLRWLDSSSAAPPAAANSNEKRAVPFQIILPANAATLGADGTSVSLNFAGLARTSQGEDANDFAKKIEGNLKPETARRFALAGIKFDSSLQLAPGYYNVRFVVRDNLSGRIGSVTAPITVK
jgi:VWFA-related protein